MGKVMEQGGMGETQRLEGRKVVMVLILVLNLVETLVLDMVLVPVLDLGLVAGLELRAGPERRLKLELDLGLGLGMGWDWLQEFSSGRDLS